MRVFKMYFSPTGTSKKICDFIGDFVARYKNTRPVTIDFTKKEARQKKYSFEKDDIVIFALPTYAGRVPNLLLPFLTENIKGNSAKILPIVLFGNRNFDESLNEIVLISKKNGFINLGAAAFVGEHSFSNILGEKRPDDSDLKIALECAKNIIYRLETKEDIYTLEDNYELKPYYRPKDSSGNFINILKVKPKTSEKCVKCGLCQRLCPMSAIENCSDITGICIKCNACVKNCKINAKYFDDEGFLYHKRDLEDTFFERKEPLIY